MKKVTAQDSTSHWLRSAFMDIHMPFMTGFDVIQKTQDVKFIIITAYDSFEHAQMALRLEVSDILAKPIRLDQLRQSIDRALGGKYTENSTVNAALAYIQKYYREDIRLSNLAEEVCCTESHLSRLFRQYMDETVISYVHHVRIKKAANLLKDGMSVQEAAEEAGYQSLNNFYKYFKQFMKETPAAYLRK
ncbi:MAG: helix-turn-helix domain-containing protein [Lachnospiraceae bacterium]|nr:helix-turn-helix domain-containing protein [Lachnospiraceae bacterium]